MRIGNLSGRAAVLDGHFAIDIAEASGGAFPADPTAIFEAWAEFCDWARTSPPSLPRRKYRFEELGPPVPRPRQVFAVALNYPDHAQEVGVARPEFPLIFTKFPSCITGASGVIDLPEGSVDWEIELVVVIGRYAVCVEEELGWDYVAGLTVGQDLSERELQLQGSAPQYSLGKSYPGFGPIGPAVVTLDEVPDPSDLELSCRINGEVMQHDRSSSMIFKVPELIAHISGVCAIYPGDLIFTGTPSGVGNRRVPQRFLKHGDDLVSRIEHLGEIRHHLRQSQPR